MPLKLLQDDTNFKLVHYSSRFGGGADRAVLDVSGEDGSVTFGDMTITADGSISIAGTAVLSGTVANDITLAGDKFLLAAAGTGGADLSLGTGIFKSSSGTNTLMGNVVITGSKTLTTGTGVTTFKGLVKADAAAWSLACAASAALAPTTSGCMAIVTAAAETNTLADPTFVGQVLDIFMDTRAVGDRVITAAHRINQANNTIMTFGAAGDYIRLVGITVAGALRWQVAANDGTALS